VKVEHLSALIALAASVGKVEVQRVDGAPVVQSSLAPLMREAGFSSTHRGLVAYGGTR
jgi:hypothetical protein